MELRHIRYFIAVAEERNFTRAAMRVGIGQPPLSQQIKDLEGEIGAPLFRRLAKGAELTEAGKAFLDQIQGVVPQVERATVEARRAGRGEVGSLRVGYTSSSAFNPVVPNAVREFRRTYPDVELSLQEAHTTELIAALSQGQLDVVFLRAERTENDDFQLHPLSEEPLVVVLPTGHPAASFEAIDLAMLRSDPFVLFPRIVGPTLFDVIMSACRTAGFEPILGQSAPEIHAVVNLVAAELGVSLVPASMRQLQVAGVAYRSITGEAPTTRLSLGLRRGDTSRLVRNFVAKAGV